MNLYRLTLQSDGGRVNIATTAPDADTARFKVQESEGCPPWAIVKVKLIKRIY